MHLRTATLRATMLLASLGSASLLSGCGDQTGVPGWPWDGGPAGTGGTAGSTSIGGQGGQGGGQHGPTLPGAFPGSCGFGYDDDFRYDVNRSQLLEGSPQDRPWTTGSTHRSANSPDWIAHLEPAPPHTWMARAAVGRHPTPGPREPASITMPGYDDDMPLFERGTSWDEPLRCYETPRGVRLYDEEEAYDLYRAIAEQTTGVALDDTPDVRSVVGLRGAHPGQFNWHGNLPDRFNDTLVLLWVDTLGAKHVREFPVNTDTGNHDFGYHNSSSLRPNRRYAYINGWHGSYNALHVDEYDYRVRDDANKNGYWDSDRNGWLPPLTPEDHDRTGGGHNIHMGSLDAPLGTAHVSVWSAGCQVIPGIANWTEFIDNAWTDEGDGVDYFLIDVRDIPPAVWKPCTPDGTHACPYIISALPFTDSSSTTGAPADSFDSYSCSNADEAGPEVVYVLALDDEGTLSVSVSAAGSVDVDVHLLDGDDPNACLARNDVSLEYDITPGRYWIVVDTYVSGGQPLDGDYALSISLD